MEAPLPLTANGKTLDVMPGGRPVTVRFTGLLKPLEVTMLIPKFALVPTNRGTELVTDMKKSGIEERIRVTGVE